MTNCGLKCDFFQVETHSNDIKNIYLFLVELKKRLCLLVHFYEILA